MKTAQKGASNVPQAEDKTIDKDNPLTQ